MRGLTMYLQLPLGAIFRFASVINAVVAYFEHLLIWLDMEGPCECLKGKSCSNLKLCSLVLRNVTVLCKRSSQW